MSRLLCFAACAVLAGCATRAAPGPADPTAQLANPQVRTRHAGDDTIAEYREAGRPARIVKITQPLAAPFYLFDDDGDERIDRHLGPVPLEYESLLVHRVPFEEYGLIGAPLPPRETCGIAIRVPCDPPEKRLQQR